MGDRIAVLNAGRIAQVGTPYEMYNEPNDVFVAAFVGTPTMNLSPAEVKDGTALATAGRFEFSLDGAAQARFADAEGPVTVGVRAEDIRIGPREAIEAVAHGVENHGVEKIVTLRINHCLLRATIPAADPVGSRTGFVFHLSRSGCTALTPRRAEFAAPSIIVVGG